MVCINDALNETILGYKVEDLTTLASALKNAGVSVQELSDASSMYLKGFMDASAHPGKGRWE